jgi:hypothetical protein
MSTAKRWTIEIFLDQADAGITCATARLDTSEDAHVHGHGAWQSLDDAERRGVADELAVARALRQIAAELSLRAARNEAADESLPA